MVSGGNLRSSMAVAEAEEGHVSLCELQLGWASAPSLLGWWGGGGGCPGGQSGEHEARRWEVHTFSLGGRCICHSLSSL